MFYWRWQVIFFKLIFFSEIYISILSNKNLDFEVSMRNTRDDKPCDFFLSLWRIYVRTREHVCAWNYISILHFSLCGMNALLSILCVHRWIISTDRTRARVTWLLHVAMTRRRGAARRESAQSESKFPLPPNPLLPPPPSSHRPSRAHHHGPLTRELSTRDLSIGFSHS